MNKIQNKNLTNIKGKNDHILDRLSINHCPYCHAEKQDFVAVHFRSPQWTWLHLCGREGYTIICGKCRNEINRILTTMN